MMDQHAFVEKKTYDELLTYNTDNGVNIDQYPNLKICTLEDLSLIHISEPTRRS